MGVRSVLFKLGREPRFFAENVGAVLDDAAKEFSGTEDMIRVGEKLIGRMIGRDLICLLGWCFLTPTVN